MLITYCLYFIVFTTIIMPTPNTRGH